MNARPLTSVLLLSALAACSDGFGESCTLIGCLTFVRVELAFASELTKDDIQIVVEHSGQSFTCDFGAEKDPCHQGFGPDFDPTGPTAEDQLVVLLNESPENLQIRVTSPAGSETRVIEPAYQRLQPNGPGCGAPCLSASVTAQFNL